MKRFFKFFVLAVILAFVTTSCYKEDIQNLQKQIDALKSGEIATIETQISSINTSITELKSVDNTLKEYITALQSDSKKYAQQIADLTAMDKTLEGKIADLQKYVDSGIKDTKDWASATFATLDQMDSVATVVAKVVAGVKQISTDLDSLKKEVTGGYTKAIEAATTKLEASMKKWVSEQLADYYSIAKLNAVLDSLGKKQSDIDSAMVEKIKEQQVALDTAKSQITAAYKNAIKVAIDSLQGKFDTKIATEIATAKNALQTQIDTITLEISSIKSRLSQAETNIAALLAQIQSISVIPTFSDGSVLATGDIDTIAFDIYPHSAAQAIVTAWKAADVATRANIVSFKIQEVMTKSAPTSFVDTVFFKDDELKVGVNFQNLPAHAMTSLQIACGKTDFSSAYFPLVEYEIKITKAGEPAVYTSLAAFRDSVNAGNYEESEYYTVKVLKDIDLSDDNWVPIGLSCFVSPCYGFYGIFDGNNHTIKLVKSEIEDDYGLFMTVWGNDSVHPAIIKNLKLDVNLSAKAETKTWIGGLADYAGGYTRFENVEITGSITTGRFGSGFIGYAIQYFSVFENCTNKANITAVIPTNADNNLSIIGGITSQAGSKTISFINCRNEGVLTADHSKDTDSPSYIGHMAGKGDYVSGTNPNTITITNCSFSNTATISGWNVRENDSNTYPFEGYMTPTSTYTYGDGTPNYGKQMIGGYYGSCTIDGEAGPDFIYPNGNVQ